MNHCFSVEQGFFFHVSCGYGLSVLISRGYEKFYCILTGYMC